MGYGLHGVVRAGCPMDVYSGAEGKRLLAPEPCVFAGGVVYPGTIYARTIFVSGCAVAYGEFYCL